jgi:hypothetical protein
MFIVVFGLTGILLAFDPFSGNPHWNMLRFFTNLSNIAAVVYFACLLAKTLGNRNVLRHERAWAVFKGIATMGLIVTGLVAQFLLAGFNMHGSSGISLIILHRVMPIMVVLDWLLFDVKGKIGRCDPIIWVAWPLSYFCATIALTSVEHVFGDQLAYPYPFIDVDALGIGQVLINACALLVAFIILGYMIRGLDALLAAHGRKKA